MSLTSGPANVPEIRLRFGCTMLPLTDTTLWEEIELKKLEPNAFRKFDAPRLLTAPASNASFYKATPADDSFVIAMGAGQLPETPHVLMFSDQEGRQFVFLTDQPRKIGASFELIVRRGFRSLYVRAVPRVSLAGFGWVASEFALPSDDFDPAQRRPLIETVFHSYTMLLRKTCPQTTISVYGPDSDTLALAVRARGRAGYLADARSPQAFSQPRSLTLAGSNQDLCAFSDLVPDLNTGEYIRSSEKAGVAAELIVPVSLPRTDGAPHELGFIRARATDEGGLSDEFLARVFEVAEGIPGSLLQSNFSILRETCSIQDISTTGVALDTETRALAEAWAEATTWRFDLATDDPQERVKCHFQKVHLRESHGRVSVGGRIVSVSAALPDMLDAQTAGTLLLKKAIRRAHSLASGRAGTGR